MGTENEFFGAPGDIRRAQAETRDRRLAYLLIERGVLTPDEAHALRKDIEPGSFRDRLVREGRITAEYAERLEKESELREVLEKSATQPLPAEVLESDKNTLMRVGRYLRIGVLGSGSMGEVWKAWDGTFGRWAALKFLKSDEPEEMQRFMREAGLVSQLNHPSLPRVYEVGVTPRPFIALEFIDGASLDKKKLDRVCAAETIRDAARAVQYAHEHGVIHRDIKPANLMLSADGRVFVTDFGLARKAAGVTSLTMPGDLLGTPCYMAPEQALGERAEERTDVYGLGATLFALVTGHPPFEGPSAHEVLQQVVEKTAPALSPNDDLAAIVGKAMARKVENRYATAGAMADDLQRFLSDEPTTAWPVTGFARLWRKAKRHPMFWALIVLVLAALIVATILVSSLVRP